MHSKKICTLTYVLTIYWIEKTFTERKIIDCIQQIRFPNPIITYQTIDVGAEIHIQFCIGLKVV
jgi:hypothetical protein